MSDITLLPGMLMLGALGRNAGKTEFACALLRKWTSQREIVGIKVTTVHERDGNCPRGGEGCGVCTSFGGSYLLTEEINPLSSKDTSRLLAAGASRVWWLRVLRSELATGFQALLHEIGRDAISICESNSLRHIVKPGLFAVLREKGFTGCKPSCREVFDLADFVIERDGDTYNIPLEQIQLSQDGWSMSQTAINQHP
jgi:hypothetical protein